MTLANCKLYLAEAKDEETKKFWSDRIARKYPTIKKVKENPTLEETKEIIKKVKEVKE